MPTNSTEACNGMVRGRGGTLRTLGTTDRVCRRHDLLERRWLGSKDASYPDDAGQALSTPTNHSGATSTITCSMQLHTEFGPLPCTRPHSINDRDCNLDAGPLWLCPYLAPWHDNQCMQDGRREPTCATRRSTPSSLPIPFCLKSEPTKRYLRVPLVHTIVVRRTTRLASEPVSRLDHCPVQVLR